MITPSFQMTASERILPKLALDFTKGLLDPRITFARSANTASAINSNGVLQYVAQNSPRFDYDMSTLACKGLLIEQTQTNLWLQSAKLAFLEKINGATVTEGVLAPDGSTDAITLNISSTAYLRASLTGIIAASPYGFSVFVKKSASGGAQRCRIATNNTSAWNTGVGQVITLTDKWQRLYVNDNLISSGNQAYLMIGAITSGGNGDATCAGNIDVWGGQLETGFTTSYIRTGWNPISTTSETIGTGNKTFTVSYNSNSVGYEIPAASFVRIYQTSNPSNFMTGTVNSHVGDQLSVNITATGGSGSNITDWSVRAGKTMTRNADVATMTGTNFSDWFNASEGTLDVTYNQIGLTSYAGAFWVRDAASTASRGISCGCNGGTNFGYMRGADGSLKSLSLSTSALGSIIGMSLAYKTNFSGSANSGTVSSAVITAFPTAEAINLGFQNVAGAAAYLNGHLKSFAYYPLQLTTNELKALSKG